MKKNSPFIVQYKIYTYAAAEDDDEDDGEFKIHFRYFFSNIKRYDCIDLILPIE